MSISVAYNLTGPGWSECLVELGDQRAHLTASYLSDALDDLLRAVVAVLRGVPESTALFVEEPGEYRWRFFRAAEDRLLVRVLWFPDWPSRLPEERGEVILDAECRLRTFAGAVLAASQALLAEVGEDGYLRQWKNPFPTELQRQLKQLLDQGTGRAD